MIFEITSIHLTFERLDKLLSHYFADLSRTRIKDLLEKNKILAFENKELKTPRALHLAKIPPVGTVIVINVPAPLSSKLTPWDFPLDILYEDEFLIFINKPAGLVVHPAPGNEEQTLVHALLAHCKDFSGIGDEKRPGIVHRLDKGTSGVMVVAKHQKTHEMLVNIFQEHDLLRYYHALVWQKKNLTLNGTIESLIARHPIHRKQMTSNITHGKKAITHYQVQQQFAHYEKVKLLRLKLDTGRTHQIRVHLSERLQAPILGDQTYGVFQKKALEKLLPPKASKLLEDYPYPLLHASTLGLTHPQTGKYLEFTAPIPSPFCDILSHLAEGP